VQYFGTKLRPRLLIKSTNTRKKLLEQESHRPASRSFRPRRQGRPIVPLMGEAENKLNIKAQEIDEAVSSTADNSNSSSEDLTQPRRSL
jgi:hypothetical protein